MILQIHVNLFCFTLRSCESDVYLDQTSRPLLEELYGGNANRKNANDGLYRAEKDFRVHAWFECAKDAIFL
jgi:hypothetical protein